MHMARLTLGYATLLAVVTLLADTGNLQLALHRLHQLPLGDKVIHFTLVGTLALLLNLSIHRGADVSLIRRILPGSLIVIIASTLEEYSNTMLSFRSWSVGDLIANYLGILCIGILPLVMWHGSQRSYPHRPMSGRHTPSAPC